MFLIYMSLETPRNNMIIKIIVMLMILLIMIIFEEDVVGNIDWRLKNLCGRPLCDFIVKRIWKLYRISAIQIH